MVNIIRNKYLLMGFLLFFAINLNAGTFMQSFAKVQGMNFVKGVSNKMRSMASYFKQDTAKEKKTDEVLSEFHEMSAAKDNCYADVNNRFDGLSIGTLQLERDKLHTMSQANLSERFGSLAVPVDKDRIGVRACNQFVPENCDLTKKPIVIVVVHGTFVPEAEDYYSTQSYFYQNVCEFAQKEALKNGAPVDIISLQWSGKNNSADRLNASVVLADILNKFYSNHKIYTIAHSHGCNVVNGSSRFLHDNLFIKHAIHLACPVRDLSEEKFNPKQFKKLTQFYSNGDSVAALGSLTQYNWLFSSGNCRKFEQQDGKITNVRVLLRGCDIGHSNAKNDIIHYLPRILDELNNYSINKDLTLNIDRSHANPVLISVKNPIAINDRHSAELTLQKAQLELELQYSESQTEIFKQTYNKDMNTKFNRFYRFLYGLYTEVAQS